LTDSDPLARSSAIRELAAFDDPKVVRLIVRMADDPDWVVRGCVAWALGRPGYSETLPTLERLANDEYPFVRFRAIAALGDAQGAEVLIRIAADEERDQRERIRAIHAMRRAQGSGVERFLWKTGEHAPDGGIATTAVAVLTYRNAEGIEERIRRILEGEAARTTDGSVGMVREVWWDKTQIICLLHGMGNRALPLIRTALKDDDWRVRASGVEELGKIDGHDAEALLFRAVNDPDFRVRTRAVEALGRKQGRRIVTILSHALNDRDRLVRVKTIGALRRHRAFTIMKQALRDTDPLVRVAASRVLQCKS
jgi:HEAT repeat protein